MLRTLLCINKQHKMEETCLGLYRAPGTMLPDRHKNWQGWVNSDPRESWRSETCRSYSLSFCVPALERVTMTTYWGPWSLSQVTQHLGFFCMLMRYLCSPEPSASELLFLGILQRVFNVGSPLIKCMHLYPPSNQPVGTSKDHLRALLGKGLQLKSLG